MKSRGSDGWCVANQVHIITGPNRGSGAPPGFLGNWSADGAVEETLGKKWHLAPVYCHLEWCVHHVHRTAIFRSYWVSVYGIWRSHSLFWLTQVVSCCQQVQEPQGKIILHKSFNQWHRWVQLFQKSQSSLSMQGMFFDPSECLTGFVILIYFVMVMGNERTGSPLASN